MWIENLIPLPTQPAIKRKYMSGSTFQNFVQYPCSGSNITFQMELVSCFFLEPVSSPRSSNNRLLENCSYCVILDFSLTSEFSFCACLSNFLFLLFLSQKEVAWSDGWPTSVTGAGKKWILIHSLVPGMWRSFGLPCASFLHPNNEDSNFNITSF